MSSLTVNITIDSPDIDHLRASKWVLCLSKRIKDYTHGKSGNIIFATIPYDQLAPSMKLTWIEKYQVYQTTKSGGSTKVYNIEPGQTANFKPDGTAEVTGPSPRGEPFVVVNNWKDWSCMGVKVLNTTGFPEVSKMYRTFYISDENPLEAVAYFTPLRQFQIFWATDVKIEDKVPRTDSPSSTRPFTIALAEGNSSAANSMIGTGTLSGLLPGSVRHGSIFGHGGVSEIHTKPHSFDITGFDLDTIDITPFDDSNTVNSTTINLTYSKSQWARV